MTERTKSLSRRNFLLAVGAGGAATAAAITASHAPRSDRALDREKRPTSGYYASEHVKTYYRTTRT